MTNIQNLKPIKSHEEAVLKGRRGGLIKSDRKRWTNLKHCSSSKCPYACLCPFMTASISGNGLCALKKKKVTSGGREVPIQPEIIESFFSLFENGKHGLIKEALACTYKIRLRSANASVKELHEYVHTILDLIKVIYPQKEEPKATNDQLDLKKPEWISLVEAERRMKELKTKNDAIDTTVTIQSDVN